MSSINPINVNTQGIGSAFGFGTQAKAEGKEAKEAEVKTTGQQAQVPAGEVLSYMAQSAVSVTPSSTKTIDPAKYVDSESAARIAGFMSQFEDIVATNLTAISQEFPGMSESAKQALALSQVDKQI